MSTSLNALANQFQAASRAIVTSSGSDGTYGSQHHRDESSASSTSRMSMAGEADRTADSVSDFALGATAIRGGVNGQGIETMLSLMMSRLENVERNQMRLGVEIGRVKDELKGLKSQPNFTSLEATPVERGDTEYFGSQHGEKSKMKGKEIAEDSEGQNSDEDREKRLEALEAKVESILESLKLE